MAINQVGYTDPAIFKTAHDSLAGDGGVAADLTDVAGRAHTVVPLPDIGQRDYTSSDSGVHFPEADDLMILFARSHTAIAGSLSNLAHNVAMMGAAAGLIGTAYHNAKQQDQVGADEVKQAVNTVAQSVSGQATA